MKAYPARIKGSFKAPDSVVGPPGAIWISADESWGIVTSATKADPAAKAGGISPDDRIAVFELTSTAQIDAKPERRLRRDLGAPFA